ncbi:MAG TPA: carboxypeptidase-like regulatory domain-containing protein, partial [Terriglobales bacterium]|nr:carboxypeptidase-like regulatory domain-containing protein [Terriglobales bacterium]
MTKLRSCLVVLAVVILTISALAQVQNGQFTGVITDPSGAAIANAKVTVLNVGTNLSVVLTTTDNGIYVAKELPVGTYKIT